MELAEESLAERLQRCALRGDEARVLAEQLTGALAYLQERTPPLVHQDVKPANILRVGERWKLADFGVARELPDCRPSDVSSTGTPLYQPPEALLEQLSSPAGDLWALGVVLLEALTGTHPFTALQGHPLYTIVHEEPAIPAYLPAPLGDIMRGCLLKEPSARWTVAQVQAALSARATPPAAPVHAVPDARTDAAPAAHVPAVPPVAAPALPSGNGEHAVRPVQFVATRETHYRPGTRLGEHRVNPRDGAVTVWVPAGEFLMGSKGGARADEKPQHAVVLDGFWIYKHHVTVAQYRKFCQATARAMPEREPDWGWRHNHPMVNVAWDDAVAYAQWAGASLPTEAQWEKAARGTDGRLYPWGKAWETDRCQCSRKQAGDAGGTAAVGTFPTGASPCGCQDMAGNVWQWCADWYDDSIINMPPRAIPPAPPPARCACCAAAAGATSAPTPSAPPCATATSPSPPSASPTSASAA